MATYVYDDFRVTLAPLADGTYEARAVDETGAEHVGVFRIPLAEDELEQAVLEVARGRSRAAATATRDVGAAGPPAFDAETIGGGLADALLAGDLEVAYGQARQRAAAAGRGLRLTLSLGAAPQLLSVPWEFLYRRPRFFANQRQTPLVRHLEHARPAGAAVHRPDRARPRRRRQPAAISARSTSPPSGSVSSRRSPRSPPSAGSQLDWLEPATPRSLRQALRDGSYHILHYVGHSDFTADGDGVLFLEDADGTSAEVDSTELANLLADQTSLRLVVLNSCEGARTTLTDPYAGVATTLVQLGVPAVVAMQFEISDAAAILFAEELYVNLIGRQDPIDAAVAEARKAIYIEQGDGTEWATPVLFMGDVDVELFRLRDRRGAAAAAAATRPRAVGHRRLAEARRSGSRPAGGGHGRQRGARPPRARRCARRRPPHRPHRRCRRRHPRHVGAPAAAAVSLLPWRGGGGP